MANFLDVRRGERANNWFLLLSRSPFSAESDVRGSLRIGTDNARASLLGSGSPNRGEFQPRPTRKSSMTIKTLAIAAAVVAGSLGFTSRAGAQFMAPPVGGSYSGPGIPYGSYFTPGGLSSYYGSPGLVNPYSTGFYGGGYYNGYSGGSLYLGGYSNGIGGYSSYSPYYGGYYGGGRRGWRR
jgi:hypothetical protein